MSSNSRHNISMTVKEAVHNVIKHAHATEVVIKIEFKDNLLTVSVGDDGRGFQLSDHPVGHGLTNMRRRLGAIGGECFIESQAGKGTTVHLRLVIKPGESMPAPGNHPQ
jgi:signal transduction histidine kinase